MSAREINELRDPEVLRGVLDSLQIGVYVVDRERRIVLWNAGAEKITGYMRHDVVGRVSRENILANCNDGSCILCGAVCPLTEVIHEGHPREAQIYLRHKAGHRVPVHLRVVPVRDQRGLIVGAAQSFEEQGPIAELGIRPGNLAAHGCLDLPTGVPNHAFTQSHLRENLNFFNEYHLPFGVLLIRVNDLQQLRASHGREAVDVMLHVVAQTMKHTLRPDGFLGRWAEDSFLAIVTNGNRSDLERAAVSVEKIVGCSGIQWWDDLLSVTVSVGQTMVQSGDTLEVLVERAERS
ncbi:MAG TPA: diguanylate cyclase, partial [Terriglobales bacterium]|nr:diguanylate cyclase [Terriglobales bacterium]